ncbi:hypothetical protein [Pleionea sediminis]|uniref:hypothetical protein n=1 Tax=Pleionea sediminis TaxID=2569479 RepID=UPI00118624EC|nr:hypothetical protein [Pleionea sediminis]
MKKIAIADSTGGIKETELYEFLPAVLEVTETPPNKVAQWITWSIIILFLSAIAWACLSKVDIVVTGRGVLEVVTDNKGNQSLQATVQFENKDIGLLERNMPVALKVDAYRFSKYGMLDGKLGELQLDEASKKTGTFIFKSQVDNIENNIEIDGKPASLMSGMTLISEVKVGERRVIDFILSPIKKTIKESSREI